MNISIKLNLAALKAVRRMEKGKSGEVDCLIIPIKDNFLFEGKNGALYLDCTAFEFKEKKDDRKDTHLVKQSYPAEVFKAMSDEDKRATPIIGNCTVWTGDKSPNGSAVENGAPRIEPKDDLPF